MRRVANRRRAPGGRCRIVAVMDADVFFQPLNEGERRRSRRSRLVATALLAVMGVVALATHAVDQPGFWTLLVRAGAEAALVGGLADWFAVTALFRHPFGVPIPHTALIPRNKDRIGVSLGSFVDRHFLDPRELRRKLREIDVAARLSTWMADGHHADALAGHLVAALSQALRSLDQSDMKEVVGHAVDRHLESLDLATFLAKALETLEQANQHHALFDQAMRIAARFLDDNEALIHQKVSEQSAWWLPEKVDRQVARTIIATVRDLIADLSDPGSEVRAKVDVLVGELIANLRTSEPHRAKVAAVKARLLATPMVRNYVGVVWDEVRRMILEDIQSPSSRLRGVLAGGVRSIGQALIDDPTMRARVNRRVEALVVTFVVPLRSEIGTFIAEVVRRWDARTVTERVEMEVGNDLQFIRVNGTVVGALVGCLLYLASMALP